MPGRRKRKTLCAAAPDTPDGPTLESYRRLTTGSWRSALWPLPSSSCSEDPIHNKEPETMPFGDDSRS